MPTEKRKKDTSDSGGDNEKGMWSSMLDSVASGKKLPEKNLVVLGQSHIPLNEPPTETQIGGSPETQRDLLDTLASDDPKRPQDRHKTKPIIANEFALGYTYQDVLDADHEGDTPGALKMEVFS